eukprot:scaffold3661_cov403-Prasinococcus_capsulatus_cf.AAC.5
MCANSPVVTRGRSRRGCVKADVHESTPTCKHSGSHHAPLPTTSPEQNAMQRRRAVQLHDTVNLYLLPVLSYLCIGGMVGWLDDHSVTKIFTAYILADFVWLLLVKVRWLRTLCSRAQLPMVQLIDQARSRCEH